jgi:hypothetical protein
MMGSAGPIAVVKASRASSGENVSQDSIAAAAEPPSPQGRAGPPDTSYYMKLGYAVAIAIFAAYIALLLKRVAAVRRSR